MSTQGDDGGEIDIDVESYETDQLEALKERITQVVNSRMSENSEGDLFTTNGGDTRWTLIDTRYGVKGLVEVGSTACDEIKGIPDSYKDRVQNRFFGTKYDQDEKWDVDMASIPWEETSGWTGCTFDIDEDSIDLIHALTSVRVPVEMRPGDESGDGEGEDEKSSQQETVVLVRKPDRNVVKAQVEMGGEGRRFNPTTEINDILESHFSFEVEDKEYMPKVQRGEWDGIVNVYNGAEYGHYQAPIGLTDGMAEVLEEEGYEVVIEGPEHGNEGADVSDLVEWVSPLDARHYQRDAIDAIHSEKKGVINLPTGAGKTITLLKFVAEIGRRTVVFVHTRELLQQWAEEVRECLGIEPTLVGEGNVEEGDGAVTVCIMQTLHSQGIDVIPENDIGIVVFDECHKTSVADTFHALGQKIDAKYRVGLTATPWRKNSGEELKIEGAVGPIIHREDASDLMEDGYLKNIRIEKLNNPADPGKDLADIYSNDYHEARRKHIVYNELRNHRIAERAFELAQDGRSVIVNCAEVDPCIGGAHDDHEQYSTKGITHYANEIAAKKDVSDEIEAAGVTSDVSNREELLERFADEDDPLKIVSSTLLQEGFDLPEVSAIVMAQAGKSETETIQTAGRALRPSGYDEALIIDVQDGGPFTTMDRQRIDTYKGYYGDDVEVHKA